MSADVPSPFELLRLLENLLRAGTIAAVNHGATRVRVQAGELLTDWLPWFERRAGDVRTWCPPSVGEQCLLLSPGGDLAAGLVLVGINSQSRPSPASTANLHRVEYPDGAVIDYDHTAHALTATLPAGGTAHLIAPGSVVIDSPHTTITGECLVQGLLTYQSGMVGLGGGGGGGAAATITGTVQVSGGDVTADGISLKTHVHNGVANGPGTTGGPQ